MENKNWWNSEVEEEWKQDSLHQVMQALSRADKALKPPVKDMFTDVYDKLPSRLQKQHKECMNMSPNTRMNIPLNYMRIKLQ